MIRFEIYANIIKQFSKFETNLISILMNELATGIFIAILVIACIENILNLLPESLPHGTGGSVVTARSTCAHDRIGRNILNFKLDKGEKNN